MFMGLLQLQINLVESKTRNNKLEMLDEAMHGSITEAEMPTIGHNHLIQVLSLRNRFRRPEIQDLLKKSMGALFTSSGSLLDTCGEAVDAIVGALQAVNNRRRLNQPKFEEYNQLRREHEEVLKKLRDDQKQFAELTSSHLLDPHSHLFDENGHLKVQGDSGAPVHGLMLGLIFEECILGVASALDTMLSQVIKLEQERTKTKIWFPIGLRNLFSWRFGKDATPGVRAVSGVAESDLEKTQIESKSLNKGQKTHGKKAGNEDESVAQEQFDMLHFHGVFWRRILLVMIGFTASAIVIFIPRPPSASRHYRRILSSTIRSSKDLYALYVTSWSHEYPDLRETSEKQILINAETLGSIAGPIGLLKFEFSSSNFDAETLTHVVHLCMTINQSLGQLLVYSSLLPQDLKERFFRLSGALDERLIGDLMAVLTLVEQALKTGDPLPAVLPVPLVAKCTGLDKALMREEAGHGNLSMETIREEGFRKYCVVLSGFVKLLGAADELVWRVKTAVGETSWVDVQQPFLSRSER